jgi:hypothetical protein
MPRNLRSFHLVKVLRQRFTRIQNFLQAKNFIAFNSCHRIFYNSGLYLKPPIKPCERIQLHFFIEFVWTRIK